MASKCLLKITNIKWDFWVQSDSVRVKKLEKVERVHVFLKNGDATVSYNVLQQMMNSTALLRPQFTSILWIFKHPISWNFSLIIFMFLMKTFRFIMKIIRIGDRRLLLAQIWFLWSNLNYFIWSWTEQRPRVLIIWNFRLDEKSL